MRRSSALGLSALPLLVAASCVGYLDADAGVDGATSKRDGSILSDAGSPDATSAADSARGDATHRDVSARDTSTGDAMTNDGPTGDVASPDASDASDLHVEGNKLVDHGKPVRLFGVFRVGTQYNCVLDASSSVFDGPSSAASIAAIRSWNVNTVRIPLNESCWLGTDPGLNTALSGANYQEVITEYVRLLRSSGLYVIVDLHWAASGTTIATGRIPMADQDNAPAFWTSVAGTFANDRGVIFDLYSEPAVSDGTDGPSNTLGTSQWDCWAKGCSVGTPDANYPAAGMGELLASVRHVAPDNVVLIAGLNQATDLSEWLANRPDGGNVVAGFETANNGPGCNTASCWSGTVSPIAAQVPVVTHAFDESDCTTGFIDQFLPWADEAGISYVAETWNNDYACSVGGNATAGLITSYDGSANVYGAGYKAHLAEVNPP